MSGSVLGLLADKKTLTFAAARALAAVAVEAATKDGHRVCIVVVDDGGHLICLDRLDGTQYGSIEIAILKAKTAIAFKRPTRIFQDAVDGGRSALLCLPSAIPLDGGAILEAGGTIVGAIGVSGATDTEDGDIARLAASALC